MTSNKPYLIRAMYEWMCDNQVTPYIYVDTRIEEAVLPDNLRAELPLVLNISPAACVNLLLANEGVSFQARFSGRVFEVYLPIDAILGILAKETGDGLRFPEAKTNSKEKEDGNGNEKTLAKTDLSSQEKASERLPDSKANKKSSKKVSKEQGKSTAPAFKIIK